jgi:hypothetical protein
MSVDPLLNGTGGIACSECGEAMTVRESIEDAVYLGNGWYLCPRCQHPHPALVPPFRPASAAPPGTSPPSSA